MNKTPISGLIFLALNSISLAASIQSDEIFVTANRLPQPIKNVIADISVITSEQIQSAGQSTIVELLSSQPGIEIGTSGGMGSSSSIFMRGTNSNQIVVLVDGVRINNITDGRTNFGNLPLAQIERIEILRGAASTLYGQDAIGGVIQIFTKKANENTALSGRIGYGSYNTKSADFGITGKQQDFSYSLNIASIDTDGFSAKRVRSGPQSDNDGYRNLSASAFASYNIAENHQVGLQFFNSDGRFNYDGAVTNYDGSVNQKKNYYNDMTQTSIGVFSKNKFTSLWDSTLRISQGIDENNLFDDAIYKSRSKQTQYSWQNDLNLSLGTITFLTERLEQRLISNTEYDKTTRTSNGIFVGYLGTFDNHQLQANYRKDNNSQFGFRDTGAIGYAYNITPAWKFSTNFGTAFKAPTFADLYFPSDFWNGRADSNPNLRPETSRNIDIGLRYQSKTQSISLVAFKNKIENLIIYSTNSCTGVSNICNINEAEIKGLSLSGWQIIDGWNIRANLDIQSPKDTSNDKLLPSRANRHGAISVGKAFSDWKINAEMLASSKRFQDGANQFELDGYAIINLSAAYQINNDWQVQGRFNNILNKNYALSTTASKYGPNDPAYNTPGANLFISLQYTPNFFSDSETKK